ncbi:MAG: alpha/beta hydrolase [Chloroflexota bacterium]
MTPSSTTCSPWSWAAPPRDGLYHAVHCLQDAPLDGYRADEARPELAFLGGTHDGVDTLVPVCQAMGIPDQSAQARRPVTSDIPTLLLSGEFDPVTPVEYATMVAKGLTHSTSVEIPAWATACCSARRARRQSPRASSRTRRPRLTRAASHRRPASSTRPRCLRCPRSLRRPGRLGRSRGVDRPCGLRCARGLRGPRLLGGRAPGDSAATAAPTPAPTPLPLASVAPAAVLKVPSLSSRRSTSSSSSGRHARRACCARP